jgi:hypothetical protein
VVTGVFGAVSQYCAGFEDSKKPRHLTVNVGSDTSVLLYHVPDVSSSNIPMVIDDQVLQLEPKGFGICTERKASQGHCDAVGTFTVKFDDTHYGLINKFAHSGEKVNLTIAKEGLYCVVTYQEGTELSHIKVLEKHSYGYLPLPLYETIKVFFLLSALLIITFASFLLKFIDERTGRVGSIHSQNFILLLNKSIQVQSRLLILSWKPTLLKFVNASTGIDVADMIGTCMICYEFIAGNFPSIKRTIRR